MHLRLGFSEGRCGLPGHEAQQEAALVVLGHGRCRGQPSPLRHLEGRGYQRARAHRGSRRVQVRGSKEVLEAAVRRLVRVDCRNRGHRLALASLRAHTCTPRGSAGILVILSYLANRCCLYYDFTKNVNFKLNVEITQIKFV